MRVSELVVFVTTSSSDESSRLAKSLVEGGLVACANIVPQVRSLFRWEGKVEEEQESLIILKTQSSRFDELCKKIKELHSYDVPEIIALPIVQGSAEYLGWVRDVTGGDATAKNG